MKQHVWKDDASCLGLETNIFFDKYEEDSDHRIAIDSICGSCPLSRQCCLDCWL
jgi:hypothetical protein